MIHQAGLVRIQTSHSFTAQLSHHRERQRESLESQANILIFHTPTQQCGTCFDTGQRKALPSTVSKPHWPNKEHSGRPRELLSDGNKSEANGKIKVQRYFISADLIIAEKMRAVRETNTILMLFPRRLSYFVNSLLCCLNLELCLSVKNAKTAL